MADLRKMKKEDTQKILFDYYLSVGGATRAEAAKTLNISKPAVSENTAILIEKGYLEEVGRKSDVVGKPGQVVQVKYRDFLILVLDVTNNIYEDIVDFAVFDLRHRRLQNGQQRIYGDMHLDGALRSISEKIRSFGIGIDQIKIAVCAAPGVFVDNREINSELRGEAINSFNDSAMKTFNELFECRILVMNDINLAATGVKNYGSGIDSESLAYLWLDVGIGSGLILNGKLYQGFSGAAGEIGYFCAQPNSYDRIGDRISIESVETRMRKEYLRSPYLTRCHEDGKAINIKSLSEGVRDGDDYCERLQRELFDYVSSLAYNLSVLLDLEMVILDGTLFRLFPEMMQAVQKRLNDVAYTATRVSAPGVEMPIIEGGYCIGRNAILKQLF